MTLVDVLVVLLVAAYAAVGYYSGLIRRVLGVVVLYLAFWIATNMGAKGGDMIVQANPSLAVQDSRIFAFFGFLILVVVVVEGMATAYHDLLQVSVVALNRASGVFIGVVTGLTAATLCVYLLGAASNPPGGGPDALQAGIKSNVGNSALGRPLLKSVGPSVLFFFHPVVPYNPQVYFEKD
jgi:uncharacterized membrane protein required for colicin V production